jgi:hypothetical protein
MFQRPVLLIIFFFWGGGGSATPCASPLPRPSIYSDYSLLVHHQVNRMTGISSHVQWPLTSQSVTWQFSQGKQFVFFITDQTPRQRCRFLQNSFPKLAKPDLSLLVYASSKKMPQ